MCYSFSKQIPRAGGPRSVCGEGVCEGKTCVCLHKWWTTTNHEMALPGVAEEVAAEFYGRRPYPAFWFQNLQDIGLFILLEVKWFLVSLAHNVFSSPDEVTGSNLSR